MKQWKLVLARTFHPTMKQLLLITPGSDRKHNFFTSQPNFLPCSRTTTSLRPSEITDGFQQLPRLSYIELGFRRSCCSQVLLQQFGTLTSPAPQAGVVLHITGLCLEEKLVKSTSGVSASKGRVHLWFPLQTAEYLPCMKLGRSSISTARSCLPSPPSPLFGPSLNNTFIPNYVRGSTKFNRKRNKTNKTLTFSRP